MLLAKVFGWPLQILSLNAASGKHSESVVKLANSTELLKHLASKMGSLITMKFERSSSGR